MSTAKSILHKLLRSLPSSYILMLHHVSAEPAIRCSGCVLSTPHFYELTDVSVPFAPLDEVIRHSGGRRAALTFDDGLEDVYSVAFPRLKEKNIPFTVYIASELLDKPGYITRDQLLEMSRSELVSVGSHGTSHGILTGMSTEEKRRELSASKQFLEELIGKPVVSFAYSHGQYDKELTAMTKHAGYHNALSTAARPLNAVTVRSRFTLPRVNVEDKTFEHVLGTLSGMKRQ